SDGRLIATAGHDRTVKLWDAATKKELATLTGHAKAITAVAFSPRGDALASAGVDTTVKLWNLPEALAGNMPVGPRYTFTRFAPRDAGFSILMPGEPEAKTRTVQSPEGAMTLHMYTCNEAGVPFMAMYAELPE